MEELQRLKNLLQIIDWAKGNEDEFEKIYQLMQDEYPNADINKDNLFKESRTYIFEKKKHPKGNIENKANYSAFLSDCTSWIRGKVIIIEHAAGNSHK